MKQHDEELIYGFDPLCGWCFAFGPTMRAVVAAQPDLPVRVLYGGLVVGERVQPIAASRDYLVAGLEQVRRTAGVVAGAQFYQGLLAEGSYISNSEPPCRAIYAVQQIAPAQSYRFAAALPDAFYGRGLPLDDADVLAELAAACDVDPDAFRRLWSSAAAKAGTQAAFAAARAAGITMYPTLLYRHSATTELIVRGWMSPEQAVARVAERRRAAQTVAV